MRLWVLIALMAAALVAAGCGGDEDAGEQPVPEEAVETVQEGPEHVGADDPDTIVRETQRGIREVTQAARELHADPDADVDAELAAAEDRAEELSNEAEDAFGEEQAELGQALHEINEQVASVARELREAEEREEVQRVIDEELTQVNDELRDALAEAGTDIPEDWRQQLDEGQREVEELERALGDAAGTE
jgi:chromosome segregation ATPase